MRAIRWFPAFVVIGCVACAPTDQSSHPAGASDAGAISGSDAGSAGGGGTYGGSGAGGYNGPTGSGTGGMGGGSGSAGGDRGGNGGGSNTGGSGSGDQSGSGVTVVNGSGNAGGGSATPPSAACNGLVPADIGPGQTWQGAYQNGGGGGGYCGGYGGNDNGIIALELSDNGHPRWDLVSPAGTRTGTTSSWRGTLFPGHRGFVLYGWGSSYNSGYINFSDEAGHQSGGPAVAGHPVPIADPRGGILMAGQLETTFRNQIWSIDGDARTRWGPRPIGSQGAVFGAGVDLQGNTLVFLDGGPGNIDAQWFGGDGNPLTGVFRLINGFVPGPSTWFETSPWIGGGLAIRRVDGKDHFTGWTSTWIMLLHPGNPNPERAPDWLTARRDTRLYVARGGRGYVSLPYGKSGPCTQRAEIVTPAGESCGGFDLSMSDRACTTYDLELGLDGTLVQRLGNELERDIGGGARTCTLRFWPAALR